MERIFLLTRQQNNKAANYKGEKPFEHSANTQKNESNNTTMASPTPRKGIPSDAREASASSIDVKTIMGKSFSVERYYMLSEIEQQAVLPVYLNDYAVASSDPVDGTESEGGETTSSINTEATVASETEYKCEFPPFVLLYLLWNCCSGSSSSSSSESVVASAEEEAESFVGGPLKKALQKFQSLSVKASQSVGEDEAEGTASPGGLPNVYVVVDMLTGVGDDEATTDSGREEGFQWHLSIAEALAPKILCSESDTLRLFGATVGLVDHARAAPGLESCLEAIAVGARDRRRWTGSRGGSSSSSSEGNSSNAHKSCVGIVCHSLQDLVGYDEETETDAVQGVMQSLTHASFGAAKKPSDKHTTAGTLTKADDTASSNSSSVPRYQPPIINYAQTAHRHWRVHKAGLPPEPTPEETPENEDHGSGGSMWVLAVLVLLIALWWRKE
jgi:hypothetical protein